MPRPFSRLFILCTLLLLATGLAACGQRVYPKAPDGTVQDINAY